MVSILGKWDEMPSPRSTLRLVMHVITLDITWTKRFPYYLQTIIRHAIYSERQQCVLAINPRCGHMSYDAFDTSVPKYLLQLPAQPQHFHIRDEVHARQLYNLAASKENRFGIAIMHSTGIRPHHQCGKASRSCSISSRLSRMAWR